MNQEPRDPVRSKRSRGPWLALATVAGLLVVIASVYIGWALVRRPAITERTSEDVRALVAKEIGPGAAPPAAAQAALLRLGFDQVTIQDNPPAVIGTAMSAKNRVTSAVRATRVKVTLDASGVVKDISVERTTIEP